MEDTLLQKIADNILTIKEDITQIKEELKTCVKKPEFLQAKDEEMGRLKTIEEEQHMMHARIGRMQDSIDRLTYRVDDHQETLIKHKIKTYVGS